MSFSLLYPDGTVTPLEPSLSLAAAKSVAKAVRDATNVQDVKLVREVDMDAPPKGSGDADETKVEM